MFIRKYRELIIYCMIGCTGALLDLFVFLILTRRFSIHYQLANFISVSFGIINNFFLNTFINFKIKDKIFLRLACFYAIGMLGCFLSACCLWFFIGHLEINSIVAKIFTIFLVTITQFSLNKLITFKKVNSKKGIENV